MEPLQIASGSVAAVARSDRHGFSKTVIDGVHIIQNHGVEGDAHAGETVKHRSRVAVDPEQPNLRQVHLIHCELFADLAADGFDIVPGELGENITTRGIDLLGLPRHTILCIGETVKLEVTGLRNPCRQIEAHAPGLLAKVVRKRADGSLERLAGIMTIVVQGGTVQPGDTITAELPPEPYLPLERV